MTARILPVRPTRDLDFTRGERRAIATWCAFRGPAWSIRSLQTVTGHGVLGIATCGSDGATDEPVPTWLLIKMPAGLLLTNALTSSPVGVYGSIVAAFTAITSIEGAEPMNDNEPSGCGELASSSMGVLPSALPYLASQIGTGFVLGRRTVQRKWTK